MDSKRSNLTAAMLIRYIGTIFMLLVVGICLTPGLIRLGQGGTVWPLVVVSALAVVLAIAAAWMQPKRKEYAAVFSRQGFDTLFSALGALSLMAGSVLLCSQGNLVSIVLGALGVVAALGLTMAANYRRRGNNPPVRCYVPAILFYTAKLFRDFRVWMTDPAILDYCFLLFALICVMLATYHAGAFSVDRGNSRALTLYALLGLYFAVVALRQSEWSVDRLIYGGSALWMLVCATQAMTGAWLRPKADAQQSGPDVPPTQAEPEV